MTTSVNPDPFAGFLDTRVVERSPTRVVVEQPDLPQLGNHVGVRHASALFAAGYEAGRALVGEALGERAGSARIELAASETAYTFVGMGPLEFVAEPEAGSWDTAGADATQLATKVVGTDQNGKNVAEFVLSWNVG